MMKLLQSQEPKCIHRHTAKTHPKCFLNGKPIERLPKKSEKQPRILIFDIECTPMLATLWRTGEQYVSASNVRKPRLLLSWSAKWLYSTKVYGEVLTKEEIERNDDSRILVELWNLLNSADIVIGHNVNQFDIPFVNTRFIINKLSPPLPYRVIDTLPTARKVFSFKSNKLDEINKELNLGLKIDTDYQLWLDCLDGDQKALSKMLTYNKNDVLIEEETYTVLRPWIRNHPDIGMFYDIKDGSMCRCGSENLDISSDFYYTNATKYAQFRCLDCGATGRIKLSKKGEGNE